MTPKASQTLLCTSPTTGRRPVWRLWLCLNKMSPVSSSWFCCLPQSEIWELLEAILEVMLPLKDKRVSDCHCFSPRLYYPFLNDPSPEGGPSGLLDAPWDHIPTFSCSFISGLQRNPAALLSSFSPRPFHLEIFQDPSFN